jgi:hypothetical protein
MKRIFHDLKVLISNRNNDEHVNLTINYMC